MQTDTPVQEYKLKGKTVLVKRDDLMGDGDVLPPWGKLAGIDSEQKHETQQNVSHTATALKQKERQLGLKPGDREWFKLWFSLPKLTGEKPI